jgi:hypothetical protein
VPASRKLGLQDAAALVKAARRVIVARGKKVQEWEPGGKAKAEIVSALLGPTGNLRAPCLRVGGTLLVGFDEESFRAALL